MRMRCYYCGKPAVDHDRDEESLVFLCEDHLLHQSA